MPAFKESFFERVVNITWGDEPEVLWVAATGVPFILNGMVYSTFAATFTSDDGISWAGPTEYPGAEGISGIFGGGWMRSQLQAGYRIDKLWKVPAGQPTWVLVGSDGRTRSGWATMCSFDGKTFILNNHNQQAESGPENPHSSGEDFGIFQKPTPPTQDNPGGTGGTVRFDVMNNFANTGHKLAVSADGMDWVLQDAAVKPSPAIVMRVTVGFSGRAAPTAVDVTAPPSISLFAEDVESAVTKKAEKKTFVSGTKSSATGKVRSGPHAGKVLTIKLDPYHGKAPAHGDGGVTISTKDPETGEVIQLGASNCGLETTVTIAYGHYVFCIGGSTGAGERANAPIALSGVSYSEDGVDWKPQTLGANGQVNVLAVGPRPTQREAEGSPAGGQATGGGESKPEPA